MSKLHIYDIKIAGPDGTIYLDTEEDALVCRPSEHLETIALTPSDIIGGYYTAREIVEGWLNDTRLPGMAGEWIRYKKEEEKKIRDSLTKWLNKE